MPKITISIGMILEYVFLIFQLQLPVPSLPWSQLLEVTRALTFLGFCDFEDMLLPLAGTHKALHQPPISY